jgi:hypothetical protein
VKERPIIFSAPMVKAILEGRKTQTRRIVKPFPRWEQYTEIKVGMPYARDPWNVWRHGSETDRVGCMQTCPYGLPGDRLWVRETFWPAYTDGSVYLADAGTERWRNARDEAEARDTWKGLWRPSIHMPRAASRITLEVTEVRGQRLQEISGEDCIAEGVQLAVTGRPPRPALCLSASPSPSEFSTVHPEQWTEGEFWRHAYAILWNQINGKKAPWSSNPWVWVIAFKKLASAEAVA